MNIDPIVFNEFVSLYNDTNELYYPDRFIRKIHGDYLDCGLKQLPHPLYATWDITLNCNLSCAFCSANSISGCKQFSNTKVLDIAAKIVEWGIIYVSIRGGEPSLVFELQQVVNYLLKHGVFVEIVTNGSYINDDFFKSISDCNWNRLRIKISLDSYNQQINDKMRGKNSFYFATKAMQVCQAHSYRFRGQMVLTGMNLKDIYDTYCLFDSYGANSFAILIVLPMGRGIEYEHRIEINNELLKTLIELKRKQRGAIVEKIGIGMKAMKLYESLPGNKTLSIQDAERNRVLKCNGGKSRVYIDWHGDAYPCEMLRFSEFFLGNIIDESFSSLWHNSKLKEFNDITRTDIYKCKDCRNYVCDTGCYSIYYNNLKKGEKISNCDA